jgi:hypothetical protein
VVRSITTQRDDECDEWCKGLSEQDLRLWNRIDSVPHG